MPVKIRLRMKKTEPATTPKSSARVGAGFSRPDRLKLTTSAIAASGMNVYFVSRPAASAAATVGVSSASSAITSAIASPRTSQSTSDQPAVKASAGVVTIAATR